MASWLPEVTDIDLHGDLGANVLQLVQKEHRLQREERSASLQEHLARIEELFLRQSEQLENAVARQLRAAAPDAIDAAPLVPRADLLEVVSDGEEPPPVLVEGRDRALMSSNAFRKSSLDFGGNVGRASAEATTFRKSSLEAMAFRKSSRDCTASAPLPMRGEPVAPPEAFTPVLPTGSGPFVETRQSNDRRASGASLPSIVSTEEVSRLDTAQEMDEHAAEWNNHLKSVVATQLAARSRSKSFYVSNTSLESKSRLQGVVNSFQFNAGCAVAIFANTIFIGVHADWAMRSALAEPPMASPEWFAWVHLSFLTLMVVELGVRLVALRVGFFLGSEARWNLCDLVLILLSVVDEAFLDADLHIFRALRMLRLLRMVRGVRLFRDLRFMFACIMQSLVSFGWALMLLLGIMFMFSICFMQAVASHLQSNSFSADMKRAVATYYPSLFDTLMSLLQCITSGVDWQEVARPLAEISVVYRMLFAFYILFVVVGVLNVLTGLFVERAYELSGLDRDLVVQSRMNREDAFLCEMKDIFEEADADGSGKISWEEFQDYLKKDEVRAYLATQQLDAYDARQLFNILHIGDDEEVGVEEFILGLTRVKGVAKSVDVVALLQETRQVSRKMRGFMADVQEQITALAPPNMKNRAVLKHSTSSIGLRKRPRDLAELSKTGQNMAAVETRSTGTAGTVTFEHPHALQDAE